MVRDNKDGAAIEARFGMAARAASLMLVASLVASCATPNPIVPYDPPKQEPRARLLMRGQVSDGVRYQVNVQREPHDCKGPQMAGRGGGGTDPEATWLPTKGLSTLTVAFVWPDKGYCELLWSFYPKAGRSYLVLASNHATGCRALIMDATNPDALVPEPTAVRRDQGGQRCMPLSQIQKAAASADPGSARRASSAPGAKPGQAELHDGVTDDQLKDLIGGRP